MNFKKILTAIFIFFGIFIFASCSKKESEKEIEKPLSYLKIEVFDENHTEGTSISIFAYFKDNEILTQSEVEEIVDYWNKKYDGYKSIGFIIYESKTDFDNDLKYSQSGEYEKLKGAYTKGNIYNGKLSSFYYNRQLVELEK